MGENCYMLLLTSKGKPIDLAGSLKEPARRSIPNFSEPYQSRRRYAMQCNLIQTLFPTYLPVVHIIMYGEIVRPHSFFIMIKKSNGSCFPEKKASTVTPTIQD